MGLFAYNDCSFQNKNEIVSLNVWEFHIIICKLTI